MRLRCLALAGTLLLAGLGVAPAQAQSQAQAPDANLASPRGPWIAERYDATHVLACFDLLDPGATLPADLPANPTAGAHACDALRLDAGQMATAQALDASGEAFHLGGAYRLLLGGSTQLTVHVDALTATSDPATHTLLGALLAVAPVDAARFRAAKADTFVLERPDTPYHPGLHPPLYTDWQPLPLSVAGAIAPLLSNLQLRRLFPDLADVAHGGPRLAAQSIATTDAKLWLVRATWAEDPDRHVAPVMFAWVLLEPAPHRLDTPPPAAGLNASGSTAVSDAQRDEMVLNVVDLGDGHSGILFADLAVYRSAVQLLEFSGTQLRPLHSLATTAGN